jgi:molybdopterin-containing oxidoreductase family membrane subunit
MKPVHYQTLAGQSGGYWILLVVLAALVAVGYAAAHYMEVNGHYVTGMSNQIVWGTPHVFAVFLIVAASGALNTASISSVFAKSDYKPLARLSALLSVALLVGGLIVLVLDLGRPERLIVAMTYYNFKSIFAWNIFLYIGFLLVVAIYLWMMFEPRMNKFGKTAGIVAFIWRFVLTTGTGSIFGFLVARQAYDAAIMAPLFIIMSLSFGTAIFLLVLIAAFEWTGRPLDDDILRRLKNLLAIFVSAVLYMTLAYHLTNLYATEHHGVERFILLEGGVYTTVFWLFQVILGSIVPLTIFFSPTLSRSRGALVAASILVIIGGLAQVYVIIIGAQAFPLVLFPGMEESSTFFDGAINDYTPSAPEMLLGIGGIGLALLIAVVAMRVLPFLPERLGEQPSATSAPVAAEVVAD